MLAWIAAIIFFAGAIKGGIFGLETEVCAIISAIFALAGNVLIGMTAVTNVLKSFKRK